jgi:hypothetical protein
LVNFAAAAAALFSLSLVSFSRSRSAREASFDDIGAGADAASERDDREGLEGNAALLIELEDAEGDSVPSVSRLELVPSREGLGEAGVLEQEGAEEEGATAAPVAAADRGDTTTEASFSSCRIASPSSKPPEVRVFPLIRIFPNSACGLGS